MKKKAETFGKYFIEVTIDEIKSAPDHRGGRLSSSIILLKVNVRIKLEY